MTTICIILPGKAEHTQKYKVKQTFISYSPENKDKKRTFNIENQRSQNYVSVRKNATCLT